LKPQSIDKTRLRRDLPARGLDTGVQNRGGSTNNMNKSRRAMGDEEKALKIKERDKERGENLGWEK